MPNRRDRHILHTAISDDDHRRWLTFPHEGQANEGAMLAAPEPNLDACLTHLELGERLGVSVKSAKTVPRLRDHDVDRMTLAKRPATERPGEQHPRP